MTVDTQAGPVEETAPEEMAAEEQTPEEDAAKKAEFLVIFQEKCKPHFDALAAIAAEHSLQLIAAVGTPISAKCNPAVLSARVIGNGVLVERFSGAANLLDGTAGVPDGIVTLVARFGR